MTDRINITRNKQISTPFFTNETVAPQQLDASIGKPAQAASCKNQCPQLEYEGKMKAP